MGRGEDYVTVTATLKAHTDRAIKLDRDDLFEPVWVPRSTLHFASDRLVQEVPAETEVEIRVMEWVAREKGLI